LEERDKELWINDLKPDSYNVITPSKSDYQMLGEFVKRVILVKEGIDKKGQKGSYPDPYA